MRLPHTASNGPRNTCLGFRYLFEFIFFVLLILTVNHARAAALSGTIDTIVGGSNGDGLSAEVARIDPQGLDWDAHGNLFIADGNNNRIRRIDATTNVITTIAGTGATGFGGDGSAATAALLSSPSGLAVDSSGNVYFADQLNQRIRRVSTAGVITTLAGTGRPGYSGDGGLAVAAAVAYPSGVSIAPDGSVLIADSGNNRIRRIDPTRFITTIAGTSALGYNGDGQAAVSANLANPNDVITDAVGNIYIADTSNCRVRRIDASTGRISTIAGNGRCGFAGDGGAATLAQLNGPGRLTFGAPGRLYIAEEFAPRVRVVDLNVQPPTINTVTGNGISDSTGDGGAATQATIYKPSGLSAHLDSTGWSIQIADSGAENVRRIAASGIIQTTVGGSNGDGWPADVAKIDPQGMDQDAHGNLYIADGLGNRIRRVDRASGVITSVAGTGSPGFAGDGAAATAAKLSLPSGVAVDGSGNVYFADQLNNRVRRINTAGVISTFAGNGRPSYSGDGGAATAAGLAYPVGIALAPDGSLLIADSGNDCVRRVDPAGKITTFAGTGTQGYNGDAQLATNAMLATPTDVTTDTVGNVYIADFSNCRIRRVDASTRTISTVAGTGHCGFNGDGIAATTAQLYNPGHLAFDSRGTLFLSDQLAPRVRAIDLTAVPPTISTVTGNGLPGSSGDGGSAAAATINKAGGLLMDPNGSVLYIADSGASNVRSVQLALTSLGGIAGKITYYSNQLPVAAATVQLQGSLTGLLPTTTTTSTDSTGKFAFANIGVGTWQIQPQKNGGAGSALSALDAVYALQAAAQERVLTAQQKLACDVSGDGTVSALDASLILQYKAGLISSFPAAQACRSDWLFVPQPSTVLGQLVKQPHLSSGNCQQGAIAYQPLIGQANDQNFAGVLLGDCTGSWQPVSGTAALQVQAGTTGGGVELRPPRRKGTSFRVPLYVTGNTPFRGLDVQIHYDPTQLTVHSVRRAHAARRAMMVVNSRTPGTLLVSLASSDPQSSGFVLMLEFDPRDSRAQEATVGIVRATLSHG